MTPPASLNHLIAELHQIFGPSSSLVSLSAKDLAKVKNLLESYVSNPDDWQQYVTLREDRFTRNLVDDGNGHYNLLLLAWGPSQKSDIHDHAGSHCMMKMLKGSLQEIRYVVSDPKTGQLELYSETTLQENKVIYMHDNLGVHKMLNPSLTEPAMSLHLYTPAYKMCNAYELQCPGSTTQCKLVFDS